ncbi:MAG TPA: hypothetical protein VJT15_17170 [Pyrinomonadaceae bacterium]|nr:hypothetical protein [Pyrinomonadaceae bacterium]
MTTETGEQVTCELKHEDKEALVEEFSVFMGWNEKLPLIFQCLWNENQASACFGLISKPQKEQRNE